MNLREARKQATFGMSDGVTIALGFIVSLTGQPHALIRAAVAAGLAELVGMTAGQWLSDGEAGFWAALTNGGAALAACVLPAVPYLAAGGAVPLAASLLLVAAIAGLIAALRPEKGLLAVVQTYGILTVAALACWAASLT